MESAVEAQEEEKSETSSHARTWWLGGIAAALAAVLFLTPMARMKVQTYQREAAMRAFVQAQPKEKRGVESRLTVFPYAPFRTMRGEHDNEKEPLEGLLFKDKADEVIEKTLHDPSPAAAHERGIAQLVSGNADKAIQDLTAATSMNDPRAWSDLAAAYVVAKQYDNAVDAANRALKLDPTLNDARFNRALAAQTAADQVKEWTDYLKHDSTSPWADEARMNLENAQIELTPIRSNP
ncbi:MAG TPA: tetratricopeptide repeat protein [Thermoanaerobaculia bacterium]|nr:tetratricopeptide repeat protein [Thermoanaerobaculia bacterium]